MNCLPYGTTIFCDDIRDEVNGKKTLVGVYSREMIVAGDIPAALPQFAFYISYFEPLELDPAPVQIKVFVPDANGEQAIVELEAPMSHARENASSGLKPTDFVGVAAAFKVAPLVIESEGSIKVRAYRNGTEIKIGSLTVRTAKAGEKMGVTPMQFEQQPSAHS